MNVTYGNNYFLPPSPVIPNSLLISSITRSNPMVVTVTTINTYIPGQTCYFSIPFTYGMYQLNAQTVQILNIIGLNFYMNIDSSQFDPFVIPSFGKEQPASLCSAGAQNTYNFTVLPYRALNGAFGN